MYQNIKNDWFLTCDLTTYCVIICNSKKFDKIKHMWEHPHAQWPPCLTATLSTLRSTNGPPHVTSAAGSGSLNTHMASGHLASQQLSPHSAPQTAHLM